MNTTERVHNFKPEPSQHHKLCYSSTGMVHVYLSNCVKTNDASRELAYNYTNNSVLPATNFIFILPTIQRNI